MDFKKPIKEEMCNLECYTTESAGTNVVIQNVVSDVIGGVVTGVIVGVIFGG